MLSGIVFIYLVFIGCECIFVVVVVIECFDDDFLSPRFSDLPSFIKSPEDQTGISGGVASFVCQAVGEPKPRITWMKKGKKVSSQRFEVSTHNSSVICRPASALLLILKENTPGLLRSQARPDKPPSFGFNLLLSQFIEESTSSLCILAPASVSYIFSAHASLLM